MRILDKIYPAWLLGRSGRGWVSPGRSYIPTEKGDPPSSQREGGLSFKGGYPFWRSPTRDGPGRSGHQRFATAEPRAYLACQVFVDFRSDLEVIATKITVKIAEGVGKQ